MTQPARDLACPEPWADSLAHSHARRRAAERNAELFVGRRSASVAAVVAFAVPATGTLVLAGAGAGAPAAEAATTRALHKGAHGPAVRRLQHLLGVHADGAFGRGTLRAVRRFQRAHGLTPDGVVGSATWSALRAGGAGGSVRHHRRRHGGGAHGLSHAQVREVQRHLGITADGMWGPRTGRAVKRFQRGHGLTPDGVVGPRTWAALRGGGDGVRARAVYASARATVRALQRLLGLPADGVFGPQTALAVRRFQNGHGLMADGIVGPATWRALGVRSSRVLKPRPRVPAAHAGRGSGNVIRRIIAAGNVIATFPYLYGGGHGSFSSSGYDCSGSVSYALHGGGLLSSPLDSSSFMSWGLPGRGRRVTVYANPGHAFLVVDGRRFDTSGLGESGTRWAGSMRSTAGYVARHPANF